MNELLLWASAVGSGTDAAFRRKSTELLAPRRNGPSPYSRAIWNLGSLAHCEFDSAAGGGWRIAPPVLAAGSPAGSVSAVLCGARSTPLIARLASAAGNGLSVEPQPDAPDLISVTMPAAGDLIALSRAAGIPIQWNAPLAILCAVALKALSGSPEVTVPSGGWAVSRFSRSKMAWVSSSVSEAGRKRSGLFRFKSDYETRHIFRQGAVTREVPPREAKYWALGRRHRAIRLDLPRGLLSVPPAMRPPALVDRALAVASGTLPAIGDRGLTYSGITAPVAAAVSAALRAIAEGADS